VSTEYEKLVQETYQAILDQETHIKNIVVQHNVKMMGKSGTSHQIDVYWEFKIADNIYRTCIECRKYTSSIKKSRVVEFKGILEDIGNTNGIIVTTVGFQEGAVTYASHHAIRLLLINPLIQEIKIKLDGCFPKIENVNLEFDQKQAFSVLEAAGVENFSLKALPQDIILYDENGNQTRKLEEAMLQCIDKTEDQIIVKLDGEYLNTPHGLIRLNSISFDYEQYILKDEILIGGDFIAKTAIKDVLENTSKYVFSDGSISDKPQRDEP
jgi:hypothetical protein